MAVKKKTATRKKATVKKKTTVKKAAVKKKTAGRKKAASKKAVTKKAATKKKTTASKNTSSKKVAHVMDEYALAMLDAGVDEMEAEHEDEPLLIHDPLAMIAGDGSATGSMSDEESSLLGNDPFAMIADGGEETEQHFGFRTEPPVAENKNDSYVEAIDEKVVEPEPDPEPEPEPVPETDQASLSEVNEMEETPQIADQHVIHLGSDLTIADVESKKIELSHILSDALPVKLNAEELEQIDGAGLQLLAALFKNAAKTNLQISWDKVSSTLMDAVKLVGLVELLNMQDVEVEDDGEGSAWGLF